MEKITCQALCKLISEGEEGKEVLKEVLATKYVKKPVDPDFEGTRESIIQVLASLTSAQSYFDFFSSVISSKDVELEEAEMELELLKKDIALKKASENLSETNELPISAAIYGGGQSRRLEQLKAEIQKLEKEKVREEVVARRQKKLIAQHARHQFLEAAALQELELLQELDRERTKEAEHEIERQRLLEQERAKTRELRHNVEMETERRTQRELQRELEQRDSGPRSRREFSSSTANSRPRERYRERDSGRPAPEGSLRPSSAGSGGREGATTPPPGGGTNANSASPLVLGGSRTYAVQPPLILKSRERTEERAYDENFDGSRDSGDAGSVGDPDSSSMDGTSVGYGARHGSRSGKPRQIVERRERDGRREGKWERKHS